MYREDTYRGAYTAELASISYMPQANPAHNICNWVEGMVYENDHARAGATFGAFKLFPGETAQARN